MNLSLSSKNIIEKAAELNVDVTLPRVVGRQTYRSNINADTPEKYYRVSTFIPFLDHVQEELSRRFLDHETTVSAFSCLTPMIDGDYNLTDDKKTSFKALIETYQSDLEELGMVSVELEAMAELGLWYRDLQHNTHRESASPKCVMYFLQLCDKTVYPSIYTLLKIMATLPVTTTENERSFSSLRRLKAYLRSTTGETRLNGLALLNIYPEIPVDVEDILDKLATKSRKMNIRLQ